jgi:DNA-binding response OmpR family regulator
MVSRSGKTTILIVEDDVQLRDYLSELLKDEGYEVFTAGDVAEGKAQFKFRRPDVILTDLVLPGAEGTELIFSIREKEPDRPIIAMSGGSRFSGRYLELADALGAGVILAKPFSAGELLQAIEVQLARH